MAETLHEQLTRYLADAHSIEEQALAQLRAAPDVAGDEQLAALYREHLAETQGQEARIRELLEARGAKPSRAKDTVMKVGGKGSCSSRGSSRTRPESCTRTRSRTRRWSCRPTSCCAGRPSAPASRRSQRPPTGSLRRRAG